MIFTFIIFIIILMINYKIIKKREEMKFRQFALLECLIWVFLFLILLKG